jgi:hypothetical protein
MICGSEVHYISTSGEELCEEALAGLINYYEFYRAIVAGKFAKN